MSWRLEREDVREWAAEYNGPPFHALLCDPPYNLAFMGKDWDKTGIAFDPQTWIALAQHLLPGGFLMAFSGARTYHRMACGIEDAGFILHPMIGWIGGQGFPKATRIPDDRFTGHRYGLQALKPALEPICVAQKPYAGKPVESITKYGAGTLWIDGGRIGGPGWIRPDGASGAGFKTGRFMGIAGQGEPTQVYGIRQSYQGRWPANCALCHSPGCKRVGTKRVRGSGSVSGKEPSAWTQTVYSEPTDRQPFQSYAAPDGLETMEQWDCEDGCAVATLGAQGGTTRCGKYSGPLNSHRTSQVFDPARGWHNNSLDNNKKQAPNNYGDSGDVSRYFFQADWQYEVAEQIAQASPAYYCSKAGRREREAGLDTNKWSSINVRRGNAPPGKGAGNGMGSHNPHPT